MCNLRNARFTDTGTYALGACESGRDPLGIFKIQVVVSDTDLHTDAAVATNMESLTVSTSLLYISDVVEIETGFTQKNYWMEWVEGIARMATKDECVVCSSSRPILLTAPSLFSMNDTFCMLLIHMTQNPSEPCKYLDLPHPLAPRGAIPPLFTPI